MIQLTLDYITSFFGLACNTFILLVFGSLSYRKYKIFSLAASGKYTAEGTITYSEFRPQPNIISHYPNEGLITYSYSVKGRLHTGKISPAKLSQRDVDQNYHIKAKVPVYYSPDEPSFSLAGTAPDSVDVLKKTLTSWFFTPFFITNLISFFIWFLFIKIHS
ncbi:DUF3592 domain-containing protein [Oceanobacter mangrovi]|uniref:DUF3592 domain-containing protein n=1 Tax=Oceanobacter mangrovi TaxID=2862510 RepID=UPI001C8EA2F2|nr:DUF3592 domain-containing protein [Oceanobacter mangrovi]